MKILWLIFHLIFLLFLLDVFFPKIPVLCWHQIQKTDSGFLSFSPDKFKRTLDWLQKRGCQTILPGEPYSYFDCQIMLSFDDGLAEHESLVMPELQKRQMKGLFFWISTSTPLPQNMPGMEIGCHTDRNASLFNPRYYPDHKSRLLSVLKADREISAHTKQRPRSFAYPLGEYTQELDWLLKPLYPYRFSVDYDYFKPCFASSIHGRFMLMKEHEIEHIEEYVLSARPWLQWPFGLALACVLIFNCGMILRVIKLKQVRAR